MAHLKGFTIIFGITMAGEVLNAILPLPVPAGVYGLFILLILLCTGFVKEKDISGAGDFLLEVMPLMFIPAGVGLLESAEAAKSILVPFVVITVLSTIFVMAVTGRMAQRMIRKTKNNGNRRNEN